MKNLNNIHAGKQGFIIGGGPSILELQEDKFFFCKLQEEITIGTNKAYKLFTPTYLVFIDTSFYRRFHGEIESLPCIKFFNNHCSYRDKTTFPLQVYAGQKEKSMHLVPTSLYNPISLWNNSGVAALRIAYLLGLNPIYLLGIDLRIQNDRSHFHSDYGISSLHYPAHGYVKCFEDTIRLLIKKNVYVYSCSPISRLNTVIEYRNLTTLFT